MGGGRGEGWREGGRDSGRREGEIMKRVLIIVLQSYSKECWNEQGLKNDSQMVIAGMAHELQQQSVYCYTLISNCMCCYVTKNCIIL